MLKRFLRNPILKKKKENVWESKLVFNPAAVYHNGLVHLLYRAVGDDNISRIGYAISSNGYEILRLDKPVFIPRGILEGKGCEDPRLVILDNRFYATYTSYSTHGVRVSLASTHNFIQWKRYGVVLPDMDSKDAVLFPEKINGRYYALSRPHNQGFGRPSIWLSESLDLLRWGNHKCLIRPRETFWEQQKIGGGAAPVKTSEGWLEIYHGKGKDQIYSLFLLLLDLNDPSVVIKRGEKPVLFPEKSYEKQGFFPNVIFSNGLIQKDYGKLLIYYGACDENVCVAETSIDELLNTIL